MSKKDIYQIAKDINKNENLDIDELMLHLEDAIEECNREKVEEILSLLGSYSKIIHQIRIIKMDYNEGDIPEQYRDIVEIIGCEKFKALIEYINGGAIYLPVKKTFIKRKRLEYMYKLLVYNNYDYKDTALEFGISERNMRICIKQYHDLQKKK